MISPDQDLPRKPRPAFVPRMSNRPVSESLLSRRLLLTGLLAGAADAALANAPGVSIRPPVRPGSAESAVALVDPGVRPRRRPAPPKPIDADVLIAEANLGSRARVGFVVSDADTGEVLDAVNPDLLLPPASVNKAVTALYVLDTLGAGHRFRTRLVASGKLENGRLDGDLVLVGSGDPTVDTDGLADLAAQAKEAGLREVTGRFLVWDGALPTIRAIDPSQPDHVGYNPGLSGLNLNFNRVHFEWRRAGNGWNTTMDARSEKHRPPVHMARMAVASRSVPIYTYEPGEGIDRWTVASGALGNSGSRWLPVKHPVEYCAEVFATFARSHGIVLPPPERTTGAPGGIALAELQSPEMRRILQDMLKYSTNLTAEAVGLAASARLGDRPQTLSASATRMSEWLKGRIGSESIALVDHSGLSDMNRICAADMVKALVTLGPQEQLQPILKDIPMRDEKYRRLDNHMAQVVAKTGTLNFVSALAGYVTLPQRRLAFATFSADTARRADIPREDREAPAGASSWARRSRILQMRLIDRWSKLV